MFLNFAELRQDLPAALIACRPVSGTPPDCDERRRVVEKSSFKDMKDREEFFEMAPPITFSASCGQFLASGHESRKDDVTPAVGCRIAEYCRKELAGPG